MEAQRLDAARREPELGLALGLFVGWLVLGSGGGPHRELQPQARDAVGAGAGNQRLHAAGLVRYSALAISNGQRSIDVARVNRQATLRCASR